MSNLNQKLEWLSHNTKHNVAGIFVQGSQNYNCDIYTDEYMSDIDVKVIIIPSFEDILTETKPFSYTYVMEDDSHIDVKDIRLYIELLKKQNPSYLEILYTQYKIVCNDGLNNLLDIDMIDEIQEINKESLLKSIKGMALEKYKALCHPYPNIKDEIEQYGYSKKQLHHLYRMYLMQKDICESGITFENSLHKSHTVSERTILMYYKTQFMNITKVLEIADDLVKQIELNHLKYINTAPKYNEEIGNRVKDIVNKIIRNEVIEEFKKGGKLEF